MHQRLPQMQGHSQKKAFSEANYDIEPAVESLG